MSSVHQVKQSYWYSSHLPHLESRSTWHSAQTYKSHSHRQLSIGAIVTGSTLCHYRGEDHLLHAGDVVLIDANEPHSCNPLAGQTRSYHMLYLDVPWCLTLLAQHDAYPVSGLRCTAIRVREPALFEAVLALVAHMQQQNLVEVQARLCVLATRVLSRYAVSACPVQAQPTTHHIRQRLLADLQASPSLTTLAQELQLRRETVVRHFRDDTGITPMAFLNNARIEYAKDLLKQGVPLADAGYQSGFSDQSHFHKTFVLYSAATPGQYRQAVKPITI